MGKHPAVSGAFLSPLSTPLSVALCTALNPALKVVNAVGGKNFARGGVVSKMCHNFFSSLLGGSLPPCDYIIPQNPSFVKGFCKSFYLKSRIIQANSIFSIYIEYIDAKMAIDFQFSIFGKIL
jgi:hypothetical protein